MFLRVSFLMAVVCLVVWPLPGSGDDAISEWHFDEVPSTQLPSGFLVGTFFDGRPAGDWKVISAPTALSPPHCPGATAEQGGRASLQCRSDRGHTGH